MKKRILVLGATGSIGKQTLDIIRHERESFVACGVSCGSNEAEINAVAAEFGCPFSLFSKDGISGIKKLIETTSPDIVVNGIAGAAGLEPSVLTLENGIDLALANKETVVMAWDIVKSMASKNKANIIPVDSEHSAIFNLTQKFGPDIVDEIIITASGGPFREYTDEQLEKVTVEMALNHPTWNMGPKITIDSATLGNKGLEVIEACRLFDFRTDKVKVVVHPQSIVHSLIRTLDGMIYAQISNPDMRHPIYGALTWPEFRGNYLEKFDITESPLTFYKPRLDSFPMLSLAYRCAELGNSYTIAYNAANEIAVQAFFDKRCSFTDIPRIVAKTLDSDWSARPAEINDVYAADRLVREKAGEIVNSGLFREA